MTFLTEYEMGDPVADLPCAPDCDKCADTAIDETEA